MLNFSFYEIKPLMKSSIYEYKDYKKYVIDRIEASAASGRGQRKKLAEDIGCQVSHISNVLNGSGHFSLEQLEACARYFGLDEEEIEYLLLVLQYNRAGSSSLKKLFKKSIDRVVSGKSKLKTRLKMDKSLERRHELEYYSSWEYGAIHVLISLKDFQTRESIAKKLSLSIQRVDQILSFLNKVGLIEKKGTTYSLTSSQIFLGKDSHLISKHHTNWRVRTLREFENIKSESLHMSGVITLSEEDFVLIREVLSNALSRSFDIVKESKEEKMAMLAIDFYDL